MSFLLPLHRKRGRSLSPQNSVTSDASDSSCSDDTLLPGSSSKAEAKMYVKSDFDDDQRLQRSLSGSYWKEDVMNTSIGKLFLLCSAIFSVTILCGISAMPSPLVVRPGARFTQVQDNSCPIPEWQYPDCTKYLNSGVVTASFTQEKWIEMRKAYVQVVGQEESSLSADWAELPPRGELSSGFYIPVEVRTSPGKGRGVFSSVDIQKGQKVWDNRHTGRFPDECSVRQFMDVIGEEDACNAIMWAYVNNHFAEEVSGDYEFMLDFDECVYFNAAPSKEEQNLDNRFADHVGEDRDKRRAPGAFAMYANRDIPAGSELIIDYGQFHQFAAMFWYEKMNYMSRGLWHYITMY
jgi:hypothetical protein